MRRSIPSGDETGFEDGDEGELLEMVTPAELELFPKGSAKGSGYFTLIFRNRFRNFKVK